MHIHNFDISNITCQISLACFFNLICQIVWYLQAWILYDEGKLKDLIDPSMHLLGNEETEVVQLINIVLSCLQQNPDRRPSMNDVQIALQGKMKLYEFGFPRNEMMESSLLEELELQSLTSSTRSMSTIKKNSSLDDSILWYQEIVH